MSLNYIGSRLVSDLSAARGRCQAHDARPFGIEPAEGSLIPSGLLAARSLEIAACWVHSRSRHVIEMNSIAYKGTSPEVWYREIFGSVIPTCRAGGFGQIDIESGDFDSGPGLRREKGLSE
jgi:hypothetical protein